MSLVQLQQYCVSCYDDWNVAYHLQGVNRPFMYHVSAMAYMDSPSPW